MTNQTNIYDTANQMARELRENESYLALQRAIEEVKADAESSQVFSEFISLQQEIATDELNGIRDQEKVERLQAMAEKMPEDPKLAALIEEEQKINVLLEDLNRIVFEPITSLYND